MATDVSLPAAAAAGLISFLSPCVLPLVPPYLCYLTGATLDDLATAGAGRTRRDTLVASLLFVAGFTTVFVALGATASVIGTVVRQASTILSVLSGLAIIVMGLHFLGLFKLGFLYREARLQVQRPPGLWSAYVMGLAFAFGWTPCIGPILAAILAVAGSQATVGHGSRCCFWPIRRDWGCLSWRRRRRWAPSPGSSSASDRISPPWSRLAGGLLVVTGIAFLTGGMQTLSFWLIETFPGPRAARVITPEGR